MSDQKLTHLHDGIEADHRLQRCRPLAAAVGVDADVGCKHCAERFHVAVARGGEERFGELHAALSVDFEALSRLAHMAAGAGGKLAAGRRIAADGGGDFVEFHPEHVVQQERRPLERRKPFERQHQRQGDVLAGVLFEGGIGSHGPR